MQKVDRRAPLPGLTALRFFAATYVLLFHLFPVSEGAALHPSVPQRLVGAGFTGVSCFFVLSGFILAYTHPRVPNKAAFFRARFARIYPLYLLAFLLALPNFLRHVVPVGSPGQLWAIPLDLALLQAWCLPLAFAINTPAWTLSCEAFFYLLFPWLIGQAWLRSRRPAFLIAVLWASQLLPPVLGHLWLFHGHPSQMPLVYTVLFFPVLRLGEFLAGIVLGLAFLRRQATEAREVQAPAWLLPLSLALCIAVLCLNFSVPHEVVRNGLTVGPVCLLIWALALTKSRFLASRPLQLGGEISYGVYLLQVPLSHWLYTILSRMPFGFLHSPAWIVLVYPFAWFTYFTVEKPCRNLLLGQPAGSRFRSKPIPTPQPELP